MKSATPLTKPIRWGKAMSEFVLPTGTVTLLMADIEGSVKLWESKQADMAQAIEKHDALVKEILGSHGGVRPRDQGEGDAFLAAFARPSEALKAAIALQVAMTEEDWKGADLRLRIALHTGEVEMRDDANYLGATINRCARLRALAHGGQTILSAATYDLIAERLPEGSSIKDLGTHRLKDLSRPEHVYQLAHPGLKADFPPLRSLEALPNNLPVQLTSFVGREKEIEEVNGLLQGTRMITLTGSGGAGKTRLALHVAADLIDTFEGGVWLADLAPLREPSLVPAAVASALKLPEERDRVPLDTLTEHLRSTRTLIILDNCEHLVNACAELADALLHSCPSLTIIATSREPLGVDGETAWRVPSLTLPDETQPLLVEALTQFEAVRLFIERATKSRPNFRITNENAPAVAQICHRLDGIPLAIELAAARVRVLTPQQISEGLIDRFHLLTGGARTAMPRQQTLQASVEWSYNLLSDEERLLLQRLAVFTGGFTLDAAEGVCSGEGVEATQVLDLLSQLIDKSLVIVDDVDTTAARYHLLETIRQYAMERLVESGNAPKIRSRHMQYFWDWTGDDVLDQRMWTNEAQSEVDNYRTAARWALTLEDPEAKLRLATMCAAVLQSLYQQREARGLLDAALETSSGASSLTRAQALARLAAVVTWADHPSVVWKHAEKALALALEAGDSQVAQFARRYMGQAALDMSDDAKLDWVVGEIEKSAETGSPDQMGGGLRATSLFYRGDLAGARALYQRAAELARASDNVAWYGFMRMQAAIAAVFRGEFEPAATELQEAEDINRELQAIDSRTPGMLGLIALYRGDYDHARDKLDESLKQGVASDNLVREALPVAWLGWLEGALGNEKEALDLFDRAEKLFDRLGLSDHPVGVTLSAVGGSFYHAPDRADEMRERFKRAIESAPRPAADFGISLATWCLARLERREERFDEAERMALEALEMLHRFGCRPFAIDSLELIAGLEADREEFEGCVRLFAATQAAREEMGYVRFPVERPGYESDLAKAREALGESFEELWGAGAKLSLDEAVEYAMRGRGKRNRPAAGWSAMTPTELRVADLVAEGLKNKEIAERLFVSPLTVETHMKNIFTKLGFSSRAELASEATRRSAI